MARKTSDQIREINAGMVGRLLGEPPQPLTPGGYALRVLESTGRTSGEPRRTPIGVVQLGDASYLVSPDPVRDWVRNLDRHPGCAVLAGDERQARRAVRAAGDEAAGVVAAYLSAVTVPWALSAFPVAAGASRAEITAHLDEMAVFRLDSDG